MVWLYNNGYRPKTARDLERFDRVLSGDTDLYVIDGLFICEGLTEDEKKPGATIDYDKIFRINFEKPIAPAQPVVTAIDPDAREAERRAQLKDWETARLLREALKKEGHKGI